MSYLPHDDDWMLINARHRRPSAEIILGKRRTDKLKLTVDFESKMVTVIKAFCQKAQYDMQHACHHNMHCETVILVLYVWQEWTKVNEMQDQMPNNI